MRPKCRKILSATFKRRIIKEKYLMLGLTQNLCWVPPVGRPQATLWPTTPIFTAEIPSRRLPWQRIYCVCARRSRFVYKSRRIQRKMFAAFSHWISSLSRTNEASGVKFFHSVRLGERNESAGSRPLGGACRPIAHLFQSPKRRSIGVLYSRPGRK